MKRWIFGKGARGLEATFTAGWSVAEVLYSLRNPDELLRDPYRSDVLADIDRRGLYHEYPGEVRELSLKRGGWIAARNPYRYIGDHPQDKIVARMARHKRPRQRNLLVMSHCYGLPIPRLMERIFSLQRLEGYDVVYNITNKHYLGSFGPWPGFGLVSPRLSQFIEVIRSAVVGLRSLVRSLQHTWGYEQVALMGYSIGGQLSLHVANSYPVDQLILYCPVARIDETFRTLGLMDRMTPHVERVVDALRANFDPDDLLVLDPLKEGRALTVDPSELLVVVQKHDMMVPPAQVEPIRLRYPEATWHEFGGTHTFPEDRRRLAALLSGHLRS